MLLTEEDWGRQPPVVPTACQPAARGRTAHCAACETMSARERLDWARFVMAERVGTSGSSGPSAAHTASYPELASRGRPEALASSDANLASGPLAASGLMVS